MPHYPTDLTDREWEAVEPLLPPNLPLGTHRVIPLRSVVNAILYRQRAGCPWRMLPHDFPHWRTVYGYNSQWQHDGTWACVRRTLRAVRGNNRQTTCSTL